MTLCYDTIVSSHRFSMLNKFQSSTFLFNGFEKTNTMVKMRIFNFVIVIRFYSSGLTLAGAFRGAYVAACSTAFRSTTEENDSGGYVDVPWPSKVKQRSSTADWLKF